MSYTVEVPCQWCWDAARGESTGLNPLDAGHLCGHCEGQKHVRRNPEDVAAEIDACRTPDAVADAS
jgi:hypothetical protein